MLVLSIKLMTTLKADLGEMTEDNVHKIKTRINMAHGSLFAFGLLILAAVVGIITYGY